MLKASVIGYLGKDCVVQQHGTDSVINFSVAHTDKFKDASGQKYEKTTWISCSYWTEKTAIAQYLRKGTLVYLDGVPEAKNWKDKQGESKAYINMRVYSIQLLGGNRDGSSSNQATETQPLGSPMQGGFNSTSPGVDDDLPF